MFYSIEQHERPTGIYVVDILIVHLLHMRA